jgi:nitrite reductase (NO-forming)
MLAALVVMVIGLVSRSVLPEPLWTMIHVITLGVLSNAILQWSWYFTRALLHLRGDDRRGGRDAVIRQIAFNIALVWLVGGMWAGSAWATVLGAGLVGAVIAWHGMALLSASRTRLGNRFAVVVRFYVAAAAFVVIGCVLAGFLTVAMFATGAPASIVEARDGLTLAHALVNLAGWIGLTMAGTIVTLGPTMLRTKLVPGAVSGAVRALPVLCLGVLLAATAAVLGWTAGIGIGLVLYATALGTGIAVPLVRSARTKGPSTTASWTMAAGLALHAFQVAAGAGTAVGADGGAWVSAVTSPAALLREANLPWLSLLGAGGMVQVFVAAMSYLMPVVIGGGPAVVRVGMGVLETGGPMRIAVRNAALVLVALATLASGPLPLTPWWILCWPATAPTSFSSPAPGSPRAAPDVQHGTGDRFLPGPGPRRSPWDRRGGTSHDPQPRLVDARWHSAPAARTAHAARAGATCSEPSRRGGDRRGRGGAGDPGGGAREPRGDHQRRRFRRSGRRDDGLGLEQLGRRWRERRHGR